MRILSEKWFAELKTKEDMNAFAIGAIKEIVKWPGADWKKVFDIKSLLNDLDNAWNAKKPSTAMESSRETSQPKCTIDISKIELLVDFPLVARGPACKECECFDCPYLPECHILPPTTMHFCKVECKGTMGVGSCGIKNGRRSK